MFEFASDIKVQFAIVDDPASGDITESEPKFCLKRQESFPKFKMQCSNVNVSAHFKLLFELPKYKKS